MVSMTWRYLGHAKAQRAEIIDHESAFVARCGVPTEVASVTCGSATERALSRVVNTTVFPQTQNFSLIIGEQVRLTICTPTLSSQIY